MSTPDRVRRQQQHVKQLDAAPTGDTAGTSKYELFLVTEEDRTRPLEVKVKIEGQPLVMELDTGAAESLVSETVYRHLFPYKSLQHCNTQLRTSSGERLPVLGQVQVAVHCGNKQACLPLRVVPGNGSSLLGRDWLQRLSLDWNCIHQVYDGVQSQLSCLLEKHQTVF